MTADECGRPTGTRAHSVRRRNVAAAVLDQTEPARVHHGSKGSGDHGCGRRKVGATAARRRRSRKVGAPCVGWRRRAVVEKTKSRPFKVGRPQRGRAAAGGVGSGGDGARGHAGGHRRAARPMGNGGGARRQGSPRLDLGDCCWPQGVRAAPAWHGDGGGRRGLRRERVSAEGKAS